MGLARISVPLTRHQAAVVQLREAIICGELAPGAQIKDQELAAQLGLSSTPVREALVQLAAEGLVVSEPSRVKRIAPIDLKETVDLLKVQNRLWTIGYEWGAPNLGKQGLQRLREANAVHQQAMDRADIRGTISAALAFHLVLMEASGNRELVRVSVDRLPLIHRFVLLRMPWVVTAEAVNRHHAQILRHLEKGRIEAAIDAFQASNQALLRDAEKLRDAEH